MDSTRQLAQLGNQRGLALVYIALIMVAICGFLGLAVDIGYMYIAKGQLQNASDAAALAGVVKLKSIGTGVADPNDLLQAAARAEAVSFANSNKVAGVSVKVVSDNSNTLSSTNDITVGRWSGGIYTPGATPVNAIQTRARRTADSPGNEVNLFLSGVVGWNSMAVSADAIAGLTVKASNYISYCIDACPASGTKTYVPPLALDASNDGTNTQDYTRKFAWTTLSDKESSNSNLVDLICKEPGSAEVCGFASGIYTSMGSAEDSLKAMEWAFYNPGLDAENKTIGDGVVTSWMVQVPVTEFCPPGAQGNQWDPHKIVKYATMKIIAVCAVGGAKPCEKILTKEGYTHYEAPKDHCKNNAYPDKSIVIESVSCSACGEDTAGLKPSLLR